MGTVRIGKDGPVIECRSAGGGQEATRDIRHDLDAYPWPMETDSCDIVVMDRTLDRVDDAVKAMEEVWRISKHGALVEIVADHFSRARMRDDPARKRFTSFRTVNFFCENVDFAYKYYSRARFDLVSRRIVFADGPARPVLEALANTVPRAYEHFLALVLPADLLRFSLRVTKHTGNGR